MKSIHQYCLQIVLLLSVGFSAIHAQNQIVYPGDVSNNGIANNVDLLYIGAAFGEMGASRTVYEVNSSAVVSGGTPPYSYQWNSGTTQANSSEFVAILGSYITCVTVTDAQGFACIICEDYVIGDATACPVAINTVVTDSTNSSVILSVNNPANYTNFDWNLAGFTSMDSSPTFSNLADGEYTVCVTTTDIVGEMCSTCTNFTIGGSNNTLNCTISVAVLETISSSATWGAQSITDPWANFFNNNLNYAYADCDGNGQVDGLDINTLDSNYGQQQPTVSTDNFIEGNASFDPIFTLDAFVDTLQMAAGATVEIPIILGDVNIPIDNFYGTAFTINYDTAFIKSGSVSVQFYLNSWIHPDNSGLVSIQKDNYSAGVIEAAISRQNQVPTNGFGEIGKLSFIIEDNLVGALQMDNTIDLAISKTKVVDEFLNEQIVVDGEISIPVDTLTSLEFLLEKELQVYPNPANGFIYIQHPDTQIESIDLLTVSGIAYPFSTNIERQTIQINTQQIPSGIYILKIKTLNRIYNKKIIIQKK